MKHPYQEARMSDETDLRDALEDMVWQFANRTTWRGWPAISTGGLSALEGAFDVLGWDDPRTVRGMTCQTKGCRKWREGSANTAAGYKWLCSDHLQIE
jgi:hypothetical protein